MICNLLYLNFRLYFPPVPKPGFLYKTHTHNIFGNIFLIAYQIFTFFIQKKNPFVYIIHAVSYLRRRVGNYLVIPNNKIFQLFSHTFTNATEGKKKKRKEKNEKERKRNLFVDEENFV